MRTARPPSALQGYIGAVGNLPPTESIGAGQQLLIMRAALSVLTVVSGNPNLSWADRIAALQALSAALGTLEQAAADAYPQQASDGLSAAVDAAAPLLGPEGALSALATALSGLQSSYVLAKPCVAALLARARQINATVLVLPSDLAEDVARLSAAQVRRQMGLAYACACWPCAVEESPPGHKVASRG